MTAETNTADTFPPPLVIDFGPPGTVLNTNVQGLDSQVLDAEAAKLEPIADPQYKTNPYGAAKETRTLAKDLRLKVVSFTATAGQPKPNPHIKRARDQNGVARVNLSDATTMLGSFMGDGILRLKTAAKTRRVSDMEAAIESVRKTMQDHTLRYLNNATQAVALERGELAYAANYSPPEGGSVVDESMRKAIIKIADRLHVLAQSLPTIPNAPLNPADNQLRAIATLLVNGGYLKRNSNGSYTLGKEVLDGNES